jgi:hypothetical protein
MTEGERPPEGVEGMDDTGEPIHLLGSLALEPELGFMSRLRGRIQRRTLVSDVATFSWSAMAHALLEYMLALFGVIGGEQDRRDS